MVSVPKKKKKCRTRLHGLEISTDFRSEDLPQGCAQSSFHSGNVQHGVQWSPVVTGPSELHSVWGVLLPSAGFRPSRSAAVVTAPVCRVSISSALSGYCACLLSISVALSSLYRSQGCPFLVSQLGKEFANGLNRVNGSLALG